MGSCPLCGDTANSHYYYGDNWRDYWRCGVCQLIRVPDHQHPAAAEEKAQYDLHQNSPEDTGYRRFLNRLCEPLVEGLPAGAKGLDFGAGPGPTLAVMLAEQGHRVVNYDPLYAPRPELLDAAYDFITLTEVAEHLSRPGRELERLWSILQPGGLLGIMTAFVDGVEDFGRWHYRRDPTHICFWSRASMEWLAAHLGAASLQLPAEGVAILSKSSAGQIATSSFRAAEP